MALPKPSQGHLDWVSDEAASKQVDPGAAKKLLGWVLDERPAFEHINFALLVLDKWTKYSESVLDEFPTNEFDAVVDTGGGGTHTSLNAATAAAASGWKILVITAEGSVTTTANITVDDVEILFKPAAHFTDGGATTAISISGDRCKIRGGRFLSFTSEAIEILGAASFTRLRDNSYSGNTADVTDGGTATSIVGDISE